jgi:RNA polymerase sigma-70 factor (ECF subfamily)
MWKDMGTIERESMGEESLDAARVYREHAGELICFATALVGRQAAEDVLSQAVVKALAAPGWRDVVNPRAYLYRVVFNEANTWRRRAGLRSAIERHLAGPVRWHEDTMPRPEVMAAVANLSVRQRAVIVLTYWADLDPVSVADRLGISEGSVRRHLARARARLREVLDA